jgi:hypothetical protein
VQFFEILYELNIDKKAEDKACEFLTGEHGA